jgi:hypothetical protein
VRERDETGARSRSWIEFGGVADLEGHASLFEDLAPLFVALEPQAKGVALSRLAPSLPMLAVHDAGLLRGRSCRRWANRSARSTISRRRPEGERRLRRLRLSRVPAEAGKE